MGLLRIICQRGRKGYFGMLYFPPCSVLQGRLAKCPTIVQAVQCPHYCQKLSCHIFNGAQPKLSFHCKDFVRAKVGQYLGKKSLR